MTQCYFFGLFSFLLGITMLRASFTVNWDFFPHYEYIGQLLGTGGAPVLGLLLHYPKITAVRCDIPFNMQAYGGSNAMRLYSMKIASLCS